MKRRLVIFIVLVFVFGCGPYIWFKVPQPEGARNLSEFSENLMGKYKSKSDTSIIRIESDQIIREYRENMMMTKLEFREEIGDTISEDTSFTFADNWDITIKSKGDSIHVFSKKDEELFKISDKHLLRLYKGYYFLNFKDTNDYWKVKVLKLKGDTLEYDYILTEDDLENIKNITLVEVITDTTEENKAYYLKPTKRELRKILKKRSQGEKYFKIK